MDWIGLLYFLVVVCSGMFCGVVEIIGVIYVIVKCYIEVLEVSYGV